MSENYRAGFVTLIGRTNVGKSTLLNAMLGEKLAIVTPKPQTTRDRILAICPVENGQLIFLDTPGLHRGTKALNRHMIEVALSTLADVDVVFFVMDALTMTGKKPLNRGDEVALQAIRKSKKPTIAVINKVDKVKKTELLPIIAALAEMECFESIVPVSALRKDGMTSLLEEAHKLMPISPPLYPEDDLTDRPIRFLVGELIREQLMLQTRQELPYSVAVEVTSYKQRTDKPLVDIDVTIHVERASQKGIILGKSGESLKGVVKEARPHIEKLIGQQVYLRTHVRVEPNWTKRTPAMQKLGYKRSK